MATAFEKRLAKVEQATAPRRKVHVLLGVSDDDLDAQEAEMRAAGKWSEGAEAFRIMLVPGKGEDAE